MNVDEAILQLVRDGEIGDQASLRQLLQEQGHALTQPTLSRHLKRLNVRKELGVYRHLETPTVNVPDYTLLAVGPNLIVLHTRPGHAQALAVLLDSKGVSGIAGTVAGDDTVFVAAAETDLRALGDRIRAALGKRAGPN